MRNIDRESDNRRSSRLFRALIPAVCALLGACSTGAHLHRPADEKTAEVAKNAFADSKLKTGLQDERALLAQLNQREAETVRRLELALRDRWILSAFKGAEGLSSVKEVREEITDRIKILLGGQVDIKIARAIATDIERLRFKGERVDVLGRQYHLAAQGKASVKCPLTGPEPNHPTPESKQQYTRFVDACNRFVKTKTQYDAQRKETSGLLATVTAQLESLVREEKDVAAEVDRKKKAYEEASAAYAEALKKSTASVIAEKAAELQVRLNDLGKQIDKLDAVKEKLKFPELGDLGQFERLTVHKAAINDILNALQGKESAGAPSDAVKPALLVASTLSGFERQFSAFKHPEVGPALIQSEYVQLELTAVQKRLNRVAETKKLLQQRSDALLVEIQFIGDALQHLDLARNGGCAEEKSVYDHFAGASTECRQEILNAVISYSTSWELGRIEQELARYRLFALDHEIVLDHSETALAQNETLIRVPLQRLSEYHAGGIRSEDLANLIHALGLSAIAIRVK